MLLDGKLVREELLKELKNKYKNKKLGLSVIQLGNDLASSKYVSQKERLAKELGVNFNLIKFDDINTNDLLHEIDKLNEDSNVQGIIVQLPISKDIDYNKVRNRINPNKDIDGVNDINIMRLVTNSEDALIPCTALGVLKILEYYNILLEGMDVTIIGRSIHIGKALYSLLLNKNASISICHSKTKDITKYTKNSDIIITSVGKANFIKQDMINDNAIIIDVGFNYFDGKICGDVSKDVVSYKYLTPVPGGVGQMTVYCIYENLLKANDLLQNCKKT